MRQRAEAIEVVAMAAVLDKFARLPTLANRCRIGNYCAADIPENAYLQTCCVVHYDAPPWLLGGAWAVGASEWDAGNCQGGLDGRAKRTLEFLSFGHHRH